MGVPLWLRKPPHRGYRGISISDLLTGPRTPEALELCQGLRVPQQRGQCLNVATTGAICLYELCKASEIATPKKDRCWKNPHRCLFICQSMKVGLLFKVHISWHALIMFTTFWDVGYFFLAPLDCSQRLTPRHGTSGSSMKRLTWCCNPLWLGLKIDFATALRTR